MYKDNKKSSYLTQLMVDMLTLKKFFNLGQKKKNNFKFINSNILPEKANICSFNKSNINLLDKLIGMQLSISSSFHVC